MLVYRVLSKNLHPTPVCIVTGPKNEEETDEEEVLLECGRGIIYRESLVHLSTFAVSSICIILALL